MNVLFPGQDNYYSNGNRDLLENERKRHEEREIDYEIEQNRHARGSEFDEDAQTPNAGQRSNCESSILNLFLKLLFYISYSKFPRFSYLINHDIYCFLKF